MVNDAKLTITIWPIETVTNEASIHIYARNYEGIPPVWNSAAYSIGEKCIAILLLFVHIDFFQACYAQLNVLVTDLNLILIYNL